MDSLILKQDPFRLNVLVLPSYCETREESPDLVKKREARLRWMREQGLAYLGDPIDKADTRPQCRSSARLISFRRHREERTESKAGSLDEGGAARIG